MQTLSRLTAAKMRYLRTEGKTRRQRRRNENIKENLKIQTLDDKLINKRVRLHGHVSRMNKKSQRILI
jgi:hypothetical protein